MNEVLDVQVERGKIFKESSVWLGSFFGGPLVAGYIIATNFKAFNEIKKAKITWILSIVATLIIFLGIFLIPEDVPIPNQIIPLLYTLAAFGIIKKTQGDQIAAHISEGGEYYSWGRVIVAGLVGLAVLIIPIILYVFVIDSSFQGDYQTKKFGGDMEHEIEYEINQFDDGEIQQIGASLQNAGFFDQFQTKYVHIEKRGNILEIYISCFPGIEDDFLAIKDFEVLRKDIDNYLIDYNVELHLVVDYLDNVVKVLK